MKKVDSMDNPPPLKAHSGLGLGIQPVASNAATPVRRQNQGGSGVSLSDPNAMIYYIPPQKPHSEVLGLGSGVPQSNSGGIGLGAPSPQQTPLLPNLLAGGRGSGSGSGEPARVNLRMTPPSSVPAITVRDACKSYSKGAPILINLNMTVPANSMYALLGSSGCGKTTMLSCCVGLRKLDSGEIRIFGYRPGTKKSGVPGRRVGFMPQDLSLYEDLTVTENLIFYGRLYGMSKAAIKERIKFLVTFLELPQVKRKVKTFSGGQKRRASIAVTLIHDPELLILDEPTVGVDPLLREAIWDHLRSLVATGRTSIIVTTHFIDEARKCHNVGIMRNGRLLVESPPSLLLEKYHTPNLESVLLILCRKDESSDDAATLNDGNVDQETLSVVTGASGRDDSESDWTLSTVETQEVEDPKGKGGKKKGKSQEKKGKKKKKDGDNTSLDEPDKFCSGCGKEAIMLLLMKIFALFMKDVVVMKRKIIFLLFMFLVPSFCVVVGCMLSGKDIKGVKIAVVSKAGDDCSSLKNYKSCPFTAHGRGNNHLISCYFTHLLKTATTPSLLGSERKNIFRIMNYEEDSDVPKIARHPHKIDKIFKDSLLDGYLVFGKEYSSAMGCRMGIPSPPVCGNETTQYSDHKMLEESTIKLFVEESEFHYANTIKHELHKATHAFLKLLKLKCGSKFPQLNKTGDFVSGAENNEVNMYKPFLTCGLLLLLMYFFPLCCSSISFITERKNGTMERMMVTGVTRNEFMAASCIFQLIILMIQALIAFGILWCFGITVQGGYDCYSFILMMLVAILNGIAGMSGGFAAAMVCADEIQAVLLAIGMFFPAALLSGIFLPIPQAEWEGVTYVAYLDPLYLPSNALRAIMFKGLRLTSPTVIFGYVSSLGWITLYWLIAVFSN